jgi:hypothetical protein
MSNMVCYRCPWGYIDMYHLVIMHQHIQCIGTTFHTITTFHTNRERSSNCVRSPWWIFIGCRLPISMFSDTIVKVYGRLWKIWLFYSKSVLVVWMVTPSGIFLSLFEWNSSKIEWAMNGSQSCWPVQGWSQGVHLLIESLHTTTLLARSFHSRTSILTRLFSHRAHMANKALSERVKKSKRTGKEPRSRQSLWPMRVSHGCEKWWLLSKSSLRLAFATVLYYIIFKIQKLHLE